MKILKHKEVAQKVGLSKVTIWRLERKGKFPPRIHLSDNCRGWTEEIIDNWIESRPRGLGREGCQIGEDTKVGGKENGI